MTHCSCNIHSCLIKYIVSSPFVVTGGQFLMHLDFIKWFRYEGEHYARWQTSTSGMEKALFRNLVDICLPELKIWPSTTRKVWKVGIEIR